MSSVAFWRVLRLVSLVTLAFVLSAIATAQSPVVWVAPSLSRIGPSDSAGSGTTAQLFAAKGESESFQIVVRAPSGGLSNVNVTVSDLQGPGGAVIPKTNFTLYRQHYVYVNSSSPDWGGLNRPMGVGWYPDGLIPFNDPSSGLPLSGASLDAVPFNLSGGRNQPIWLDVRVPYSAAAGTYTGSFTVSSNQGNVNGSISLTVWNFALPMQPALESSFLLWQADSMLSQQELLRHRLSPLKSSPLNQPSLISNYGLKGVGLPFWSGADLSNCSMSSPPSVSEFQASATQQDTKLHIYTYSADEIGHCTNLYPNIKEWARNMHQAGVDNLITMSPAQELFDDGSGTGRSAVDVWVLLPIMYDQSRTQVGQALQKGDQVWSYNTLVQDSYSPKWTIDFAPINFRIHHGFINQSLNLTGILYWRVDLWQSDPWNNVNNTGTFSSSNYPGDGMLVYPGQQVGINGVAPSIRLKWLRDGVDDYEYIDLLKKLGRGTWALELSRSVGADWGNWTRDPAKLESVRRQLGDEINRLSAGSSTSPTAPSAPTNPSPANGASGVSVTPTLSWSGDINAASYDVYFGTTTTPAFVSSTTGTSYSPGTLASGTTYYWRVVAKNSVGTASSSVWSFVTGTSSSSGNSAPVAVSANPSSGEGSSQTLSFAYSDPNGAADLAGAGVLINGSVTGSNACWLYYDAASKLIWLANDDASNWSSAAPGSGTSLSNSQCSFPGSSVSVQTSGNSLTLSVALIFNSAFAGGKNLYLYANDKSGLSSGFTALGSWTVPSTTTQSAPSAPSNPSPANGATGVSVTPALSWSGDSNATSYDVYFGTSTAPAYVSSTTGTSYSPGTLASGTTYYWRVVAKNSAGNTSSSVWSFVTATSSSSGNSAPAAVSVNPDSGEGSSATFSFTYSDPNGASDLAGAGVLINGTISGAGACWFYYDAASKQIWLANDDGSSWSSAVLGSPTTLSNSQCSFSASSVNVQTSGNSLVLTVSLDFTSTFAGGRTIYLYANDKAGLSSGFQARGTWNVLSSTKKVRGRGRWS